MSSYSKKLAEWTEDEVEAGLTKLGLPPGTLDKLKALAPVSGGQKYDGRWVLGIQRSSDPKGKDTTDGCHSRLL